MKPLDVLMGSYGDVVDPSGRGRQVTVVTDSVMGEYRGFTWMAWKCQEQEKGKFWVTQRRVIQRSRLVGLKDAKTIFSAGAQRLNSTDFVVIMCNRYLEFKKYLKSA